MPARPTLSSGSTMKETAMNVGKVLDSASKVQRLRKTINDFCDETLPMEADTASPHGHCRREAEVTML